MGSRNDRGKQLRKGAKKTRALIPKPLRERLARVLALAADSPRIDMLSGVRPFALMPIESRQGLQLPDDTLQELLERGAQGICKLEGIGPQLVETLVQQLAKMLGLEATALQSTPSAADLSAGSSHKGSTSQTAAPILIPIRGSIDAEVHLNDCFARLRACPALAAARNRPLKDFWDASWPRAPFEEQFTLAQIAGTKAEVLLKKRSFGPSKIAALIAAVERFISQSSQTVPTTSGEPQEPQGVDAPLGQHPEGEGARKHMHLLKGNAVGFSWHPKLEVLSFVVASLLRGYEQALGSLAAQHPLKGFLEALPSVVHAQDFANLLLAAEAAHAGSAMIGDHAHDTAALPQRALTRCLLALRKLFKKEAPEVYAHWEGILRLPATRFSVLVDPYIRRASEREFMRSIAYVLAASLSAKTPLVWGRAFAGYASFQGESLEKFLNLLVAKLPCSHEMLGSQFELLLSGVDSALLFECLKQRAYFDKQSKLWRSRD